MRSNRSLRLWVFSGVLLADALLAGLATLRADTIELVNGDMLNGKVVSLDTKQLQLVSDIHGKLSIAREKVAAIALGERKLNAAKPIVTGAAPTALNAADNPAAAIKPAAAGSVADILKQLQTGGVGAGQLGELEQAFPQLKEAEAKKYFDKTVAGLTDGSINVGDVRKDAIRVREQLRDLTKDLGPQAEQALSGYTTILDKFIRESEPAVEAPTKAKAEPPKKSLQR